MERIKKFSKSELISIFLVLLFLFAVSSVNMSISLRRGRDATRKNDISAIQKELDSYLNKYKVYPLSDEMGNIIGCFNEEPLVDPKTSEPLNLVTCRWGESSFESMSRMPRDPSFEDGSNYLYISDGKKYNFYISLEGQDEAEYTPAIAAQNLKCGNKICNYGRSN